MLYGARSRLPFVNDIIQVTTNNHWVGHSGTPTSEIRLRLSDEGL